MSFLLGLLCGVAAPVVGFGALLIRDHRHIEDLSHDVPPEAVEMPVRNDDGLLLSEYPPWFAPRQPIPSELAHDHPRNDAETPN